MALGGSLSCGGRLWGFSGYPIEQRHSMERARLCGERLRHIGGPELKREETTLCFARIDKASLAEGPAVDWRAANHRCASFGAIDECHHAEQWWFAIMIAGRRDCLTDQFGCDASAFGTEG